MVCYHGRFWFDHCIYDRVQLRGQAFSQRLPIVTKTFTSELCCPRASSRLTIITQQIICNLMLLIFLTYITAFRSPNDASSIAFRTDHKYRNTGSEILESLSRNRDDRCRAWLQVLDQK